MNATLFFEKYGRSVSRVDLAAVSLVGIAVSTLLTGCMPEIPIGTNGASETASRTNSAQHQSAEWAAWQRFERRFITPEGRVVDRTFGGKTTSEGQSYGLFFALVAGDRKLFARLLRWTDAELAEGKLG